MSLCGSLVTNQRGILRLSHYSVKEYLTSDRLLTSPLSAYHVSSRAAHCLITKSCLLYLRHYDRTQQWASQRHEQVPKYKLPLYLYSICLWPQHHKLSEQTAEITMLALDILGCEKSVFNSGIWRQPSLNVQRMAWDPQILIVTDEIDWEWTDAHGIIGDKDIMLVSTPGSYDSRQWAS